MVIQKLNIKLIFVLAFMGLLVLLGGFVYSKVSLSSLQSSIAEQNDQIVSLQGDYTLAATNQQEIELQTQKDATGLDMARVALDDKAAEQFFQSVLTWNDEVDSNGTVTRTAGQVYDEMRDEFIRTYGDDNSFVKTFLPENKHLYDKNYIDAFHVNSTYESMESYVKNISSTGNYSYLAFVNWSTHDSLGNEAISECVFSYTVDGDGNILNPEAWVLDY